MHSWACNLVCQRHEARASDRPQGTQDASKEVANGWLGEPVTFWSTRSHPGRSICFARGSEKLAHALPEDPRIRLANSLYESVGEEEQASEAEIEAAWGDEIKRRLEEINSGAVELIPLEDVLAGMNERRKNKRGE